MHWHQVEIVNPETAGAAVPPPAIVPVPALASPAPPAGGPDPPPRPALATSLPHTMSAGGTTVTASWWHLFKAWAPLGYTTFGGPSAHVGQYLLVR